MHDFTRPFTLSIVFFASVVCSTQAYGVTTRVEQNGAGACQGALPAFAGTLRARPLAFQNEGQSPAFVTCALRTETNLAGGVQQRITRVRIFFANNRDTARTVSCTLVDGSIVSTPTYLAKSQAISPGFGELTFEPANYPTPPPRLTNPNVSCSLPPDIGIGVIWIYHDA